MSKLIAKYTFTHCLSPVDLGLENPQLFFMHDWKCKMWCPGSNPVQRGI